MKITDALESVLRLLVSTDQEASELAAERPLPDWVKRVNDGHTVSPLPRTPQAAEPDQEPVEEQGEEDPVSAPVRAETAPEAEPAVMPAPPVLVPPVPAAQVPALVVADPADDISAGVDAPHQDFSHLESAANLAESLNLGFHLGSAVERIASGATQGSEGVPALQEAAWLIERYIAIIENRPIGADLHLTATRLARAGDGIAGLKALAEALDLDAPPA